MTPVEVVKALLCCRLEAPCDLCPAISKANCMDVVTDAAADLIERLEKEKAALIEAANPRKLCDICKHDSWCADHGCNGNLCEECGSYSNCPCSNCMSYPKWEWKGPEPEAPEVE